VSILTVRIRIHAKAEKQTNHLAYEPKIPPDNSCSLHQFSFGFYDIYSPG
jgi:hypothetical protein